MKKLIQVSKISLKDLKKLEAAGYVVMISVG